MEGNYLRGFGSLAGRFAKSWPRSSESRVKHLGWIYRLPRWPLPHVCLGNLVQLWSIFVDDQQPGAFLEMLSQLDKGIIESPMMATMVAIYTSTSSERLTVVILLLPQLGHSSGFRVSLWALQKGSGDSSALCSRCQHYSGSHRRVCLVCHCIKGRATKRLSERNHIKTTIFTKIF